VEKGDDHRCYLSVDQKYFEEVVLNEYFVRCELCPISVGLGSLKEGGWKRVSSTQKKDFNRGFLCEICSNGLGL